MMLRRFLVLCVTVIALMSRAEESTRELVLVTARENDLSAIPTLELRKLYLGINISVDGAPLTGYMRSDDRHLRGIFLQSVLAMSEQSFDRRSLLTAMKYGTPRPADVEGAGKLADVLRAVPLSVGYMWRSEADSDERVRIIQILWREG